MIQYIRKESRCRSCPFRKQNKVWGMGGKSGDIVFLGDAPNEREDQKCKPFVGEAGKCGLDVILKKKEIVRENNFITYVINCRPPDNNFNCAEAKEARYLCKAGLLEELFFLKKNGYKIIVPMGNNALTSFGFNGEISKIRGRIYTERDFKIVPVYHPEYVLENNSDSVWKEWEEDFDKILKIHYNIV